MAAVTPYENAISCFVLIRKLCVVSLTGTRNSSLYGNFLSITTRKGARTGRTAGTFPRPPLVCWNRGFILFLDNMGCSVPVFTLINRRREFHFKGQHMVVFNQVSLSAQILFSGTFRTTCLATNLHIGCTRKLPSATFPATEIFRIFSVAANFARSRTSFNVYRNFVVKQVA